MKKIIIVILCCVVFAENAISQIITSNYQGAVYLPTFITGGMTIRYEVSDANSYSGSTTLTDLMGNVNAALYNNPTYTSTGTKYLNLNSGASTYLLTGSIGSTYNESVFMWVYPTADGVLLSELGGSAINSGWHDSQIEMVGGTMKFSLWPSSVITSSVATPINMWHYVGYTYDGTTLTAYVNGTIAGSINVTRSAPADLYYGIGGLEGTHMGNGGYGNFRLNAFHYYKRALSLNEVKLNYNSTLSKYQTQPYKYLKIISDYLANYRADFKNPSFYSYTLDGDKYFINDGGGDMYDGGNFTSPWLKSNTAYTSSAGSITSFPNAIDYSVMSAVSAPVDSDFYYLSMGYANSSTTYHPLTVLGSRSTTGAPVGFQVGGNSGADGTGTLGSSLLYNGTVINGFTVYAFYRETYGAGDPSHCNLFILLGHPQWGSVFGTINSFADPVSNGGNGAYFYTSGASTANILAIQTLLSKSSGVQVTAAECQTIVTNYTLRIKQALGY
jgi:hypothetical protein